MEFNETLRYLRQREKLTQKELAAKLGCSESSIGMYERGEREPDFEKMEQIADLFNVDLEFLHGRSTVERKISISPTPSRAPVQLPYSPAAQNVARRYDALDDCGRDTVEAVMAAEERRLQLVPLPAHQSTKTIPLFGAAFAAGHGEPDFGNPWEDYEVPADSKADFAIRVSGDSMEPYLHDGSIALGCKAEPRDGDVAALMIDGEFLVKQVMFDYARNLLLFSLNRERKDADRVLYRSVDHTVMCFGVILMDRVPLPLDR